MRRLLALFGCVAWWASSSASQGYDATAEAAVAMSNEQLLPIDALAALAVESVRRKQIEEKASQLKAAPAAEPEPAPLDDAVAEPPAPAVPGMEKTNLVIKVSTEPGRANEVMASKTDLTAAELMAESSETILRMIARNGWRVEPADEPDCFDIFLNPVTYELPIGVITIPAPHFRATTRNSRKTEGRYKERLETDLVLQNGDGIVTVSLNFPFSTSFSIGAAGWLRAYIGEFEEDVRVRADVEIGLNVPRFPGLGSALQCFVKHYVQRSTFGCATSFRTSDSS